MSLWDGLTMRQQSAFGHVDGLQLVPGSRRVRVSTFHRFCLRLLRRISPLQTFSD